MVSTKALYIVLQKWAVRLDFSTLTGRCILDDDMEASISFEAALSSPCELKSGLRQGLALILFGIFFSAVLKHAFHDIDKNIITDGVFLSARADFSTLQDCLQKRTLSAS